MSFIDDMKIGKKLIGGFLIVVLILVVVAAIGYMNMGALDKADTELYQDRTIPLGQLGSVDADLQQMRAELYRYVYVPSARSSTQTTIANLRVNIKKELDAYRATSLTPSEKTSLASFDANYAQWDKLFDDAIAAADKNDMRTVDAALTPGSPLINARTGAVAAITDLVKINTDEAKKLSDANTALYNSSSMMMIIATIVGVIIAIALALFLSKSITAPLDLASKNLKEMGMGHLGNRMKMSRKDEIGEMASVMDSFSDDLQNNVVAVMKKIAVGDLSTVVKAKDNQDEISPALITMTNAINAMTEDARILAKAAVDGKLDTRADVTKHQGDFRNIVEGVNKTLDAVIGPLNVTAEYVDRISKGDIPPKITDNYNGDFNEIKNNLNNCIDVMNGLLAETNGLIKATKEGKLDTRGNSQKFPGGWGTLVGGVNELVDAFVHPINVTAEYVDRISKGDIPPKITDTYNGDFNEIKNNLNNCIDVMNGLLAETNGLIKATKEGKLDTRGNSQKFPGGWGTLVGGVNELVDAFVHPINVTAEYVDRISKGDIPPKITDTYNGDFNEIKNNLNNCIDVMNGLLDETNGLIKATQDGKLQTRGNAQKFNGGWGKLVGGVNDLIEAFVHPIKVTSEYIDRISKGDVPKKITDTYNGDFNEIKNNLNNCIDGLQGLVECDRVLHCMAMNDHSQKVEGKYQGIFASTAESTNMVRERLLGVTKQINEISMGDTKELPDLIKVGKRSEQDHLLPAIINCLQTVENLLVDSKMLAKAAEEGKLDTRADASKHQGEYKVVIEGINKTLDSVIGPLNVAAEYVDRISKGEVPKKITDTYNGDFNEIKNNLNNCIDGMQGLVESDRVLHCMAMNDHSQKVEGKYQGIFASTAESTNMVRERLLGVTKQINEIAMGDTKELPDLIKVGKRSEQDHLLPAIINCLQTVENLLVDSKMLAKAAEEGKLDTRADASKHQGEYKVVIEGINKTLDSVIGPLNVAAEYVDRISKGDIPARITDNYNGDFNEIKNNLNNCIDAVNMLVADAAMLAKAADEGKLKTRADASKHTGDYKKIVDGVNQTLDSVIEPVNEALRVSKGYATQDFTTRVDNNLKVPGDWLAFKEALNNIGVAVSTAVTNISSQVTDLAAGAEEANASVEEVTAGAGQVAKNTSAVSTNVEKSMAGIEQVQKAMEDLSRTIQEVATRADVTAKLVQDTTTYSKEGMDLARKTENGMQGITKSSNDVNVIILEIKGQMDKISEIVNLITDLANQTNLLALNAAIEAARAGDAGRGFAVVATEVKSLAVESRASAEKISEMINNLQSKTNNAVDAVASANTGVREGSEALHDTLSSFTKIVESIDQVSKNVSDVAAAAEEQAASVEEVTASVNEVNGLMQSTAKESTDAAAASEESAAAIDQISKVIGNVNNIVDKVTKEVSKFKC